jgi:hypothetical protein
MEGLEAFLILRFLGTVIEILLAFICLIFIVLLLANYIFKGSNEELSPYRIRESRKKIK